MPPSPVGWTNGWVGLSKPSPWFGFFGFALAVAYCPWITGAASTPRWLVLAILACAMSIFASSFEGEKSDIPAPVVGLGLAFLGWSLLTVWWSPAPERVDAAWKLCLLASLFAIGTRIADLRPLLIGCAAGLGVSSGLVALDRLGLMSNAGVYGGPAGLFGNGLYLAEFAAMVTVGLLAYGFWWWALVCAPAVLLVSLPRGPLLALAVGLFMLLRTTKWWLSAYVLVGAVMVFVPIAWLVRPATVLDRIETWGALIQGLRVFGHGLGSYAAGAPLLDAMTRKLHANNDLLEIFYETGMPGIALALVFLGMLIWPKPPEHPHYEYGLRRGIGLTASMMGGAVGGPSCWATDLRHAPALLIVVVFLVEGLVGFPWHMPATAGLFALAAGHLAAMKTPPQGNAAGRR